jgi:hypothetical protein
MVGGQIAITAPALRNPLLSVYPDQIASRDILFEPIENRKWVSPFNVPVVQ